MRINNKIAAILLCATAFLSAEQVSAKKLSARHEQVKKLFQSSEERTAKDAVWTAKDIFKVGVIDNGSRRDGYADYVCQVLYEYGFKGREVWVQIIDIIKLTRNNKWVKLGESRCQ